MKVWRAATLVAIGLTLVGCSPNAFQANTLSAADPTAEPELETVSPPQRAAFEEQPVTRAPPVVPRTGARRSTQSESNTSPQTKVESQASGTVEANSNLPLTPEQGDTRRKQEQLSAQKKVDDLNRSAARAIRSICTGC